jgi:hypothetical protein
MHQTTSASIKKPQQAAVLPVVGALLCLRFGLWLVVVAGLCLFLRLLLRLLLVVLFPAVCGLGLLD